MALVALPELRQPFLHCPPRRTRVASERWLHRAHWGWAEPRLRQVGITRCHCYSFNLYEIAGQRATTEVTRCGHARRPYRHDKGNSAWSNRKPNTWTKTKGS